MQTEVMKNLIEFIVQNFQIDEDEISLDSSLIDEGVIDSFGLIEIAGFMNREYDLTIEDTEITVDNFGSIKKIVHFICSKAMSSN